MSEAVKDAPSNREVLRNFYTFVAREIPEGIIGSEHSYPVKIRESELQAVIFGLVEDRVALGLFMREGTYTPKQTITGISGKYSRKTLEISRTGEVREDPVGTLPDFDLTDNEPDFSDLSDEEVAVTAIQQILKFNSSSLN